MKIFKYQENPFQRFSKSTVTPLLTDPALIKNIFNSSDLWENGMGNRSSNEEIADGQSYSRKRRSKVQTFIHYCLPFCKKITSIQKNKYIIIIFNKLTITGGHAAAILFIINIILNYLDHPQFELQLTFDTIKMKNFAFKNHRNTSI